MGVILWFELECEEKYVPRELKVGVSADEGLERIDFTRLDFLRFPPRSNSHSSV
jgi:hypothetical protein